MSVVDALDVALDVARTTAMSRKRACILAVVRLRVLLGTVCLLAACSSFRSGQEEDASDAGAAGDAAPPADAGDAVAEPTDACARALKCDGFEREGPAENGWDVLESDDASTVEITPARSHGGTRSLRAVFAASDAGRRIAQLHYGVPLSQHVRVRFALFVPSIVGPDVDLVVARLNVTSTSDRNAQIIVLVRPDGSIHALEMTFGDGGEAGRQLASVGGVGYDRWRLVSLEATRGERFSLHVDDAEKGDGLTQATGDFTRVDIGAAFASPGIAREVFIDDVVIEAEP